MSKKRKSVIPEFGKKAPMAVRPTGGAAPPVAPRAPVVKPQSTNAKSGRRGA